MPEPMFAVNTHKQINITVTTKHKMIQIYAFIHHKAKAEKSQTRLEAKMALLSNASILFSNMNCTDKQKK